MLGDQPRQVNYFLGYSFIRILNLRAVRLRPMPHFDWTRLPICLQSPALGEQRQVDQLLHDFWVGVFGSLIGNDYLTFPC
jgi:hypothetical protein